MTPLTICGIDPGERHCAAAVIQGTIIHHVGLIDLGDDAIRACAQLRRALRRLIQQHGVQIVAVEDFEWFWKTAKNCRPIYEQIGVIKSFSDSFLVELVSANAWQAAIVGHGPVGHMSRHWSTPSWKRQIRAALLLHLRARDILDGESWLGDDQGNHKADALGIALYCGDRARLRHREAREMVT